METIGYETFNWNSHTLLEEYESKIANLGNNLAGFIKAEHTYIPRPDIPLLDIY